MGIFDKESPSLDERLLVNWHWIADPGPEIYRQIDEIDEDRKRLVTSALTEAAASIALAKGVAYTKIGRALSGANED